MAKKKTQESVDQIFFAGPWITEHEISVVTDMLRNGWYDHPYDYCENFQDEFAAYHDRKFGIMTPSCTTAIHLLLTGLGISAGDEVLMPDCTWIASGAGISYLGATPVFCDIDPVHWCIDPESVLQRITDRTKAIIAVDLFGNMPLMNELLDIADKHNLVLIEDAAEALGSTYRGKKAGGFGKGSVFSFHRTKTLTTGEGGMLLLDDEELYERCMFLRDHGRKPDGGMYYNYEVTYKYMPSNYQAALGYAQFQRIEELIANKRTQLKLYREGLHDIEDIEVNPDPVDGIHGGWMPTIILGKSYNLETKDVISKMAEYDVPCRPFFYPLSSLPAYPGLKEKYENLNLNSYDIHKRGVNLPCAGNLTVSNIAKVCECIKKVLKNS